MALDSRLVLKVVSPRIIAKALSTLDRSTAVVVSICWCAAFIVLIFAVYTVHATVAAKKLAADAALAEPVLPLSSTSAISPHESQMLLDRLQHQFPDIKIEQEGPRTVIRTSDGAKFHQWITAITYIDAMEPQYRWTVSEFCVGHCGQDLMKAVVTGQRVTFSLPQKE
jgi:hypothetical protein